MASVLSLEPLEIIHKRIVRRITKHSTFPKIELNKTKYYHNRNSKKDVYV